MVRYDRGADWSLEESGESYQFIRQEKGDSYLYYTAKRMTTDWMGDCWLESVIAPYHVWKEEGNVRWDQLGGWNRWIGPDTGLPMEELWDTIQRWCRGEGIVPTAPVALTDTTPILGMDRGRGGYRGRGGNRGNHVHSSHQEYRPDPGQGRGGRGGGRGRERGREQYRGRGQGSGRGNIRI